MNRLSCIGIGLLALGALATGCGDESIEANASSLAIAPTELAELDLPGCEALAARGVQRWGLLGHPHDAALVVVTADGCPVCVDTREGALLRLAQLDQVVALDSSPAAAPDSESGSQGTEGTDGDESEELEGARTLTTGIVTKRSLISDDPLPPPGNGRPALAVYTSKQ